VVARRCLKEIGCVARVKNITLLVGRHVSVVVLRDFHILPQHNFRKGIGFAKDAMNIIMLVGLIALFAVVPKKDILQTGVVRDAEKITLPGGFIVFIVKHQNRNKHNSKRRKQPHLR